MSLILPAVQNARRAARKLECQNNVKQMVLAIHNVATGNGDKLPRLVDTIQLDNPANGITQYVHSWPVTILPALDNAALHRTFRSAPPTDLDTNGSADLTPEQKIWVKAFTCPDDQNNHQKSLGLSYVANAGYISTSYFSDGQHDAYRVDYDVDGTIGTAQDASVAYASGVFWRPAQMFSSTAPNSVAELAMKSDTFRSSLDYISQSDGTTSTIMIGENITAGLTVVGTDVNSGWASPLVHRIGFGWIVDANQPAGWSSAALAANNGPLNPIGAPTITAANWGGSGNTLSRFNSHLTSTSVQPRLSSNHAGALNVGMCDGSVRSLSENMDQYVYARLLTPDGRRYGQQIVNQTDY